MTTLSSDALLVLSLSVLFLVLRALNVAFKPEHLLHRSDNAKNKKKKTPKKLLVVIGSGGHTAEMMTALRSFPETKFTALFYHREYVLADTDRTSRAKIVRFEEERGGGNEECFGIHVVPRAREVGQSYLTSAFTTLRAFWHSWRVYAKTKPDAVLTNGPGTCIPVLLACFLGKMFWFNGGCKVMYVESVARTKRMSLSGRLCYSLRLADVVFVMWPELREKYPRTRYCGRIY
jgi:beta-1,4-N-acetylglucosaminyltransferase